MKCLNLAMMQASFQKSAFIAIKYNMTESEADEQQMGPSPEDVLAFDIPAASKSLLYVDAVASQGCILTPSIKLLTLYKRVFLPSRGGCKIWNRVFVLSCRRHQHQQVVFGHATR